MSAPQPNPESVPVQAQEDTQGYWDENGSYVYYTQEGYENAPPLGRQTSAEYTQNGEYYYDQNQGYWDENGAYVYYTQQDYNQSYDQTVEDDDAGWNDDDIEGATTTVAEINAEAQKKYRFVTDEDVDLQRAQVVTDFAEETGLSVGSADSFLKYIRFDEKQTQQLVLDYDLLTQKLEEAGITRTSNVDNSKSEIQCALDCQDEPVPVAEACALSTCGHWVKQILSAKFLITLSETFSHNNFLFIYIYICTSMIFRMIRCVMKNGKGGSRVRSPKVQKPCSPSVRV